MAPDEIECRVLLKLPNTNPTPTLAASLRHTMTAERLNRVVALRKVNILAAAPTDRDVSGASRTARVIELPLVAFAQRVPQLSILRLVWTPSLISLVLACPRINRLPVGEPNLIVGR